MDGLKYVLNKQQMRYRMRMQYISQHLRWGWALPRWMLRGRR